MVGNINSTIFLLEFEIFFMNKYRLLGWFKLFSGGKKGNTGRKERAMMESWVNDIVQSSDIHWSCCGIIAFRLCMPRKRASDKRERYRYRTIYYLSSWYVWQCVIYLNWCILFYNASNNLLYEILHIGINCRSILLSAIFFVKSKGIYDNVYVYKKYAVYSI